MKHLKLTVVGLLALATVTPDAFAFGPPGSPPGGPPHLRMGGGGPVGNITARGPAGNTFGNVAAGPAGNFSGNIVARGPAGNFSGSGNIAEGRLNSGNVNAARNTVNYGNVNACGNGGYGSGGDGSGYYGNGYNGNGSYWGAHAAGAATGTEVGAAAASSDRSSTSCNYYTSPCYSYTCWDAQNQRYYSSTVPCSG
jgi:hypothetical protein